MYLPRDDHHIRLPTHCCGRSDLATGSEVRGREKVEALVLNEGYAVLIPEDEDVLVGMRARKTVRMRRSSRQHVTRATLVGAHKMMMMMMM